MVPELQTTRGVRARPFCHSKRLQIAPAMAHNDLPIDQGAPTNADGTLNLVHYTAWILKQMGRGAGEHHAD